MDFKRKTFRNGLNVFTIRIPEAESVVVTVVVKVGSRYENTKTSGMAHFLEHVFFKGSQNYPNPSDIQARIDEIGGDFNAVTTKETTEFYIRAEKRNFDRIFDALTDMINNPLFLGEEIEKEKGVVTEEINLYNDNPSWQIYSILDRVMWPDAVLGADILGTKENILNFDRDTVFKFKSAYYQPNNIILGISGDFDEQHALKKVEKYWTVFKRKPVPDFKARLGKQKNTHLEVKYRDTQQAQLALGFKSFGHDHRDNPAIALLASILGGSTSSRLWLNIREQKGLAYSINASNSTFHGAGHFTISAGLKTEKTLEALKEILGEIRKVKSVPVSEKEITLAKNYIRGKMALMLEDIKEKIDWVTDRFAATGKPTTPDQYFKKILRVSVRDIQRVANEIFRNDRMSLAVIGPFKSKTEFQQELQIKENF